MHPEHWQSCISELDFNPIFVTISGAHIYGFPSIDSDIDFRGCHQLPLREVVGLTVPVETIQIEKVHDDTEVDLVSHEIGKYLRLLVKNNGYIMEQVFSPLIVTGQEFLQRLKPLAKQCLTRNHFYHYRGFYNTQRSLIDRQAAKQAKTVLYAYRVLLTGKHLLKTGFVETDLRLLNTEYKIPEVDALIAAKTREQIEVDLDWQFHAGQLDRLESELGQAFEASTLPEKPNRPVIDELLIDLRLQGRS